MVGQVITRGVSLIWYVMMRVGISLPTQFKEENLPLRKEFGWEGDGRKLSSRKPSCSFGG
jgi:hypothetical protein